MNTRERLSIQMRVSSLLQVLGLLLLLFALPAYSAEAKELTAESEELMLDDADTDADEIVIEDDAAKTDDSEDLVIDEESSSPDEDEIVIEDDASDPKDAITIESEPAKPVVDSSDSTEPVVARRAEAETATFKIDEVWAEYASIPDANSHASGQVYVHAKATANWRPSSQWEFQLSGRVDGYEQFGSPELDDARLDYDDSFVRYRNENLRLTVGAQKILWGRIDENPPTDRLSTQDFSRYILDDLADRRRANPAIRLESFFGQSKLDLVYLPYFRAAELPDKESIWYPVDRRLGQVIGAKSTAMMMPPIQTVVSECVSAAKRVALIMP